MGCGNAALSRDMFDVGYSSLTNIDISEVVIEQMKRNNKDRAGCSWLSMDATAMTFENESFSVLLDKGTLDAMMSEESDSAKETIHKYFSEVQRVLKNGGRFLIISLLQEHIVRELLSFFPANNFLFRVVRCIEAEQKTSATNDDGASMPVFIVVATKFMKLPLKIYEVSQDGQSIERLANDVALAEAILSIQRASIVRNGLIRKGNFEEEINFGLFRSNEKTPRFTLFILDQTTSCAGSYAAFICPQGRETEWLFATKQGRRKLMEQAGHSRLAIVIMHRNQTYESLDTIKEELNESVKSFAPKGLKDLSKIPFLSLGSDVGKRTVIYNGTSEFSGDFVIEDVADGLKTYRRLIFLSNQSVIQSEALMKPSRNQKHMNVDFSFLSCQHHIFIVIGALMVQKKETKNLIIGLGGGGLVNFLYHHCKDMLAVAVEIDPEIVKIAKSHFGLSEDNERLEIVIDDGLKYLKDIEKDSKLLKYQSIIFDIDSKDNSAISCPPGSFLEDDILKTVKSLLRPEGLFILNFVCRDNELRKSTLRSIKKVFSFVISYKLEEDLNEIFYCFAHPDIKFKESFQKAANKLNSIKTDSVELDELMEKLKLN